MLGGVRALPRSAQYAQESAEAHRRMLQDTGVDPADIKEMYPDAPLQWLAESDKGIGGKILGGVGDVGALLSTIAGKPIGPPRMGISDIASASKMRKQFREEQSLNELAKTETDPVGKALLGTGSMDAYGRYKAAQLRAQGGMGMFGTSGLGMRSRLAWLKANQPDSPDIPALEKGIAEEDVRHPIPQPPQPRIPPGEAWKERHEAEQQTRDKEAQNRGYKPGTDEYNYYMSWGHSPPQRAADRDLDYDYFFKQALAAEKQRAAAMGDVPNMQNVTTTADAAYKAYQERHTSKGGTAPPQTPTPLTGAPTGAPPSPPPSPGSTPGPTSYETPPVTSEAPAPAPGVTMATPEQLAARKKVLAGAATGMDPRTLRETAPDLWAAADLAGTETLPLDQFYKLLSDPVAFAQWRAGQAAQPPQQGARQGPLPQMHSEKTRKAMAADGVREFLALQTEIKARVTKDRQAQIAVRLHQLE